MDDDLSRWAGQAGYKGKLTFAISDISMNRLVKIKLLLLKQGHIKKICLSTHRNIVFVNQPNIVVRL